MSTVESRRAEIVKAAVSQLGVPYVYGGTTPGVGFDCSGLSQWCCAKAGLVIPRGASAQLTASGPRLALDAPAGCLAFFYGGEPAGSARPGHVGIVTGPGIMIDAPYSGQVVRHDSFSQSATVGPMDFYGYSDPASMAVVPAPVPVAQTADVKLRVLQEGMSGIDVSRVQNILKFLGIASLTADGIFGPATKEGVERYQRMLELTQDGIVGKETWANLLAAPNQ